MKTLLLLRHAKSRRDIPGLTDFERPLADRGRTDIALIAKQLKKKDIAPDVMISSPANRAITTARLLAEFIGYPRNSIRIEEAVYDGWQEDILHLVSQLDPAFNAAIVVGHNPELQNLAWRLCGFDEENLPTSGLVGMSFDVTAWNKLEYAKGRLRFFEYPKKYY